MASITSFLITNFKGAAEVRLDFESRISTPVITLIGLNESGKTTILEALSYFVSGDNAVSSLFEGPTPPSSETFIPIHKKAAFTGEVEIRAVVRLTDEDVQAVVKMAQQNKIEINTESFPRKLEVARGYLFADSAPTTQSTVWTLDFEYKAKGTKKWKIAADRIREKPTPGEEAPFDIWLSAVRVLRPRLPRIAYFPTFLVDLPKQIYLEEHEKEEPVNRYYRIVLQDVLTSLDEGLSLKTHVCDRITSFYEKETSANWLSKFFGGPSKAPIDAVFQKISAAVTREVLGSWENIFNRKIAAKAITVEWHIDTQKDNLPYATFSISDGDSKYAIDQRSLGFRWFFSFLLFTTFKQKSQQSTIFIFDEPAANLHAKAQSELLKSFSRITKGENRVIYSTHSHHMINPRWLSGAYIVENTAIDHDSDDAFGLTTRPTNIIATRYREFVAKYPSRTTYFQPVIEQLEYITPELLGASPFLLVEGITDFYALQVVFKRWMKPPFSVMPGCGAGASGPQISSMLGRGERFLIMLDDDEAGKIAAKRYREEWYLAAGDVVTLATVHPEYSGKRLEGLISNEVKVAIAGKLDKEAVTKKEIGWYLAELCADPSTPDLFDKTTQNNLTRILDFARDHFAGG